MSSVVVPSVRVAVAMRMGVSRVIVSVLLLIFFAMPVVTVLVTSTSAGGARLGCNRCGCTGCRAIAVPMVHVKMTVLADRRGLDARCGVSRACCRRSFGTRRIAVPVVVVELAVTSSSG